MPVTVHPLNTPDERDVTELERIAAEQIDCPSYLNAWQRWQADRSAIDVRVARFNERIVGVVLLREGVLVGFAVRAATRGRGVGSRMLSCLAGYWQGEVSASLNEPVQRFIERHRQPA